ncbi:ATP synthase subunit delta [Methylocaldum marinum]|uniref:ATP synthase subunit delta n=1 Tax=Methylocaldum marinum TaxID=1432792 RepID=A0A250KVC2_9GAMM|nr:F0F1 ATP synthase subunit delta [Methylocaldum marinum]BBA35575.1 ATP synthase subunit delta [Methylocaldum marinum]
MDELTTLARPYAVAVYKRAKETGTAEKWSEALAFVWMLMEDEQLAKASANPKANREQFSEAFLGLCKDHLDSEAQNFVRLLIQNRRLGLVRYIAELFNQYKADDEGYIEVDVSTAFPLKDTEQDRLSKVLEGVLAKKARLRVDVDPSLIGGVYIKAGDRVIDASIRGQVERLAKRLWN